MIYNACAHESSPSMSGAPKPRKYYIMFTAEVRHSEIVIINSALYEVD